MTNTQGQAASVTSQIARWLSVIGALNWGLVGIFNWDLVRGILGNDPGTSSSAASRAVYTLVGLAGIGLAVLAPRRRAESKILTESVSRA
jgi:uncharacterized membrane protein YuzA (DUF378 family)